MACSGVELVPCSRPTKSANPSSRRVLKTFRVRLTRPRLLAVRRVTDLDEPNPTPAQALAEIVDDVPLAQLHVEHVIVEPDVGMVDFLDVRKPYLAVWTLISGWWTMLSGSRQK